MKPGLIFVYNADSGIFNALADTLNKIFSPQTYACNLCALTYSNVGMRKEWKLFIERLEASVTFLHRDEFCQHYEIDIVELPAVFTLHNRKPRLWLSAEQINACNTLAELKDLIELTLKQPEPAHPGKY